MALESSRALPGAPPFTPMKAWLQRKRPLMSLVSVAPQRRSAAKSAGESGALVAEIDLERAAKHRAGMGFFRDRRPQLYGRICEDI